MTQRKRGRNLATKTPLEEALRAYRPKALSSESVAFNRDTLDQLSEIGHDEATSIFEQSLSELEDTLRSSQPTDLLAALSLHFLTSIGNHGLPVYEELEVNQAHIEFVQALALRLPAEEYEFSMVGQGAIVEKVAEQVQQLFVAHSIQRQRKYGDLVDAEELQRQFALDSLRIPTQYLRNWGFPEQMKRIMIELFDPLDPEFIAHFGVGATSLVGMLHTVVERVEDRFNDHFLRLIPAFSASTPTDVITAYLASFPDMETDADGMLALVNQLGIDLRQLKALMIAHSSLRFASIFTFSLDELQACCLGSVDSAVLATVLDDWSLSFGDLSDVTVDHIFLDNPIWFKPFIKLDSGTYMIPIVGGLVSFSTHLLDSLSSKHTGLKAKYERRRAGFLETAVAKQMKRLFPVASVYTGSQWRPPQYDTEGENDVLVVTDEIALILEAKSSQTPAHALRGAYPSSKTILKKLAVDATVQGQNFAVALDAWRGVHTFPTRSGQPNIVDTTNVGSHLFYNISFALLTLLSIRSRTLDQAGLLPTGFIITPVATLAELELIINVLQDELQFMHYVQTRIRIEALDGLVADELDIFAFYLLGCPKIEVLMSTPDVGMVLYGQSKLVDIAVATEKNLSETNWPGTQRSALIQALIDDLRTSGAVGWVHAGLSRLSIPYREQVVLDRILKQLENTVWKSRGVESIRYKIARSDAWDVSLNVILMASRGIDFEREKEFVSKALSTVAKTESSRDTIVVSSNSLRQQIPCVVYASPNYRVSYGNVG